MTIALIWAMSENRVIGKDGDLPWRLPADLAHFQRVTRGHTVIMGRKTFESLPRALPERRNMVITRQADYRAEGAEVFPDLTSALAAADASNPENVVFVLGGAQIYELALPLADELFITFVEGVVEGDTYFPTFDITKWRLIEQQHHPADERNRFSCRFTYLVPKKAIQKAGAVRAQRRPGESESPAPSNETQSPPARTPGSRRVRKPRD